MQPLNVGSVESELINESSPRRTCTAAPWRISSVSVINRLHLPRLTACRVVTERLGSLTLIVVSKSLSVGDNHME